MKEINELLEKFKNRMEKRKVRLHGAVLMQGKKVIGEVYNFPYNKETKTRLYSTSKSIASVAIGKLVKEGKLSLDEKIVDIFADKFDTSSCHPYLKEQTVKDMLKMTTVYSRSTYWVKDKNWLETYFGAVEPTHPCGTVWYYDSSGSYVLGAIVKHRTGKDFVEYLRPEFDEIGVSSGVYCFEGPDGEAWASSAVVATTSDIAKIAYLMLEKGEWNGKQLIDREYCIDAISPLERNDDGGKVSCFDCGYGYQIWSHPNGAFAFRGLGGQVAIGFPGRDLVFSCTADTAGMLSPYDEIFNAVDDLILPEFPVINQEEYERAQRKPVSENVFDKIKNKDYVLRENPSGISKIRFEKEGEIYKFFYTRNESEKCIDFAIDKELQITFPEKYVGLKLFNPDYDMNYNCSVKGEWLSKNKLRIWVWAEDVYVGNLSMAFAFRDNKVGVKMQSNAQFFFDDFKGFMGGETK